MIYDTRHGLITKSKFIRYRKMCYLVVQLGLKNNQIWACINPSLLAPVHCLVVNA